MEINSHEETSQGGEKNEGLQTKPGRLTFHGRVILECHSIPEKNEGLLVVYTQGKYACKFIFHNL